MPRRKKCRNIRCQPDALYYKPRGIPAEELEENILTLDEVEALRLADVENRSHEEAAAAMGVSRATFGRIVASARRSVAEALLTGKAIRMQHASYAVPAGSGEEHAAAQHIHDYTGVPMDTKNIKIAAVTDNGKTISAHFGRAGYYEVLTIEDGKITARERREKPNHHAGNAGHHQHEHKHGTGGHGMGSHEKHQGMAEVISDCQMLLARGMGYGAYASMEQLNIVPCVTDIAVIEEAVQAVIEGTIVDHTEKLH